MMKRRFARKSRITVVVPVMALLLFGMFGVSGCGVGGTSAGILPVTENLVERIAVSAPGSDEGVAGEIMIAAAARLQRVLEKELIPLFEKEYPVVKVTGTYDCSGKLRVQIENGLPADIFFSADKRQMDALVDGGFVDGATVVDLLENRVVLATGMVSETKVKGYENILDAKSIALGDPDMVPAGRYAKEILEYLGLWEKVESRASYGMSSAEVYRWVAEGSAEVGVVYQSDCLVMPVDVRLIAADPVNGSVGAVAQVVYPVGLRTGLGEQEAAARAFLEFLQCSEARAVFDAYGFQ